MVDFPPFSSWNEVFKEVKEMSDEDYDYSIAGSEASFDDPWDHVTRWLKIVVEPDKGVDITAKLKNKVTAPISKDPLEDALKFLDNVKAMLKHKNVAYGNAALNPVRIFSKEIDPIAGILVRIDDKLSRIARGTGVENEDVIMDLVGYLALFYAAVRKQQKKEGTNV